MIKTLKIELTTAFEHEPLDETFRAGSHIDVDIDALTDKAREAFMQRTILFMLKELKIMGALQK